VARVSGDLGLTFQAGETLRVPSTQWETWQLRAEGSDYHVVSVAGGGVVIFGDSA
jgi:hypothetical protein